MLVVAFGGGSSTAGTEPATSARPTASATHSCWTRRDRLEADGAGRDRMGWKRKNGP